ncbi:MAG: amino acid permease [Acidobacteriota bacterium]|nr:amino acid permease [Acidobacteriota bacterium]
MKRTLGPLQATAANMLEMIGVGPFLTIPLLLARMNGPQAMLGWLIGAAVALCDGLVWAELGAAMPGTGGPYIYLSEAYGPKGLGRLMSFLFIWSIVFVAPLSIAAGAVGFGQYTRFLWPAMLPWQEKGIAVLVCVAITVLLYRDTKAIGRLGIVMLAVVIFTVLWITGTGLIHFHMDRVLDFPPHAFTPSWNWFAGLGGATLLAMYDYGGYNNVCFFAGEVKRPERVIPQAILWSILAVAALYLTMNVTIIGVVPWREAIQSKFIVSDFILRIHGSLAAKWATGLILFTTFASLFAVLLGYSRVPYAAAIDGRFFSAFGRLHPTRNFPAFSLVFFGATSALACVFDLADLLTALIVIQIMVQFMAQVVAVTLIRRNRPDIERPFKMWLYPWTSVVALAGWAFILAASDIRIIAGGLLLLTAGIAVYLWRARMTEEWPFSRAA